ncbi:MAG: rhodanese-like domain-containing protein [Mariprofundaceae bacterium]
MMIILIVVAIVVVYLIWLRLIAPKVAGVRSISIDVYRQQFKKQPHLLLDVRSDAEFAYGHAPRARHMSVESVAKSNQQTMEEMIKGKDVVCICKSGSRSMMAATVIARMGFKPVYSLEGGMPAWRQAGLTVRKDD